MAAPKSFSGQTASKSSGCFRSLWAQRCTAMPCAPLGRGHHQPATKDRCEIFAISPPGDDFPSRNHLNGFAPDRAAKAQPARAASANRCAQAVAICASRASTITRNKGSVPLARIRTRPEAPSSSSTAWVVCANTLFDFQSWPGARRTLSSTCG